MNIVIKSLLLSLVLMSVGQQGTVYGMKKTVARNLFGAPLHTALSPLAQAVIAGNSDAVRTLIATGANPYDMVLLGKNVLMYASENGFEEIAQILIDAINGRHVLICEGLRCPQTQSFGGIVRAYEAPFDTQNAVDGKTALMYAALNGHAAIVRLLVEANADTMITDIAGLTVQQLVMAASTLDIVNKIAVLFELTPDVHSSVPSAKRRRTTK